MVRTQQSGVGVDRLLPLDGPTPEGAGPVVEAPGDPYADSLGCSSPLPSGDGLQVVHAQDDTDDLLGITAKVV